MTKMHTCTVQAQHPEGSLVPLKLLRDTANLSCSREAGLAAQLSHAGSPTVPADYWGLRRRMPSLEQASQQACIGGSSLSWRHRESPSIESCPQLEPPERFLPDAHSCNASPGVAPCVRRRELAAPPSLPARHGATDSLEPRIHKPDEPFGLFV